MAQKLPRRLDRLIYAPVIAATVAIWGVVAAFTIAERNSTLDRATTQLGFSAATLADANVAAESSAGLTPDQISATRTAAIWRALLQYPTARIWLTREGDAVLAGEPAEGDLGGFIVAEEARGDFTVHAALPKVDALADWRRVVRLRVGLLAVTSIAFLFLTSLLARTLRQRAAAEQATAAAMQRLMLRDRALEVITQGVTITDERQPGAPSIYTNPAFAALTRDTPENILGRGQMSFLDEDGGAAAVEKVAVAHETRSPWRLETELKRKDGTAFLDSMATALILDQDGRITHSVTMHEDVTELRQREELLLEAQKMESIGQLTGGIAHDFNNLLTAIKSNAEDLKEDLQQQPLMHRQADLVLQAANRGAGLVAQLMAFARKERLQPQAVQVNDLLDTFTKLMRSTVPANVHIEVRKADTTPAVFVDPGRLESALLNLCINSRDAMPDGGTITIETMVKELDAEYVAGNLDVAAGTYVLIAVTDTGGGMPPHVVERAFTPFFTTKEVGKGTGLGLSMVYGFVKQSGGNAKIYSEIGLGTVIRIYLPAMAETGAETGPARNDVQVRQGSGRILVVEDDDIVRQSISGKLVRLGYEIKTAGNALDALEALKASLDFDLVFSDVIMPGPMTGADLVREVRRRWPMKKVLLTSGYTESTILGKIKLPENVALLSKPYSNAELAQAVAAAIAGEHAVTAGAG